MTFDAFPAAPSTWNPTRWRAELARVRAGTAPARLLCIGDSTTAGFGATFAESYPARLASRMNANLIPTSIGTTYGKDALISDPRIVLGAGWASSGLLVFGQAGFTGTVAGGLLSFTPAQAFNTITIYHYQTVGGGTSTINVDGGASLGNIVGAAGVNQTAKTTFSCAQGTHTINIASPTGAALTIGGIETSSTVTREVLVANAGHSLTTTVDWSQNPTSIFSAKTQLDLHQPDLTIINLSINDSSVGRDVAKVAANLAAIIGWAKVWGDVIVVNPNQVSGTPNQQWQPRYTPAIAGVAAQAGAGYVDLGARWGTWTAANALGLYFDNFHPSNNGYADIAAAHFSLLAAV